MALEDLTGTKYLDDLNSSNPAAGDNVSEGDDHIRGIKNVLKLTFPNIDAAVNATPTELNYVDGVTSAIQTQLGTKAPLASPTFTGTVAIPNVANLETAVVANTAKVTNATHCGDVTGSGALTIAAGAVDIAMLSATGTAGSSTFLRGDNSWVAVTTDLVGDTSPQLGGFLDANGNYMQTEKGGDIASASPTVIDTDGDYFDVTGTTNFSAFTVAADRQFTLQFDGVLTMTHHATNLDLPGEANITTAAGDVAVFQSTAANQVQCICYTRASGEPIVGAATATLGFFEHTHTISSNLTITTDYNALSAGPITVASGYSVTVPSGSTWVIA